MNAQELKLTKATLQTVNHGASPTSTTTYLVQFQKKKKSVWSIDSVISISSAQQVKYTLVKIGEKGADYTALDKFSKSDKGFYQIRFAVTKQRGSGGRPGAPQNQKADTTVIEGGVIVYYSIKGKSKQLKVTDFEQLETVDAP